MIYNRFCFAEHKYAIRFSVNLKIMEIRFIFNLSNTNMNILGQNFVFWSTSAVLTESSRSADINIIFCDRN